MLMATPDIGRADLIGHPMPEQIDHLRTGCFFEITLRDSVYYHDQY
jgi:hypothetical protein